MESNVSKLNTLLKVAGYKSNKRAVLVVYLSIVLLGKKIPEVALFFHLSEIKVQTVLTVCGVKLKKNKQFMAKMHQVARSFMFKEKLELIN